MFDGVTSGMMLTCTGPTISNLTVCMVFYGNVKTTGFNHFLTTESAWAAGALHCRFDANSMYPLVSLYSTGNYTDSAFVAGQPTILIYTLSISSGICSLSFYINGGNAQIKTPFPVTLNTINLTNFDIGGYNYNWNHTFYGGISSFLTYTSVHT